MFSDYSKSPSNVLEHTQGDATGGTWGEGKTKTLSAPATNSSECVF